MPAQVSPDVHALAEGLRDPQALESLHLDPYWPKWDSPWWWMTLLLEMGEVRRIPRQAIITYAAALRSHYLPDFPLHEHELPPGKEGRHVMCHCAIGTAYQVLHAWGLPVDAMMPGARPWFTRYQLSDGGWNCDEAAYTRPVPRSSVVSSLPILEALLATYHPLTPAEEVALDAGAAYLLERRLFRSLSGGGKVIDARWLQPIFPRFYEYDVLRGARFLARWALRRRQPLPRAAIAEAMAALETWAAAGCRPRRWLHTEGTLTPEGGTWVVARPAPTFALLDAVSDPDRPNPWLRREWEALRVDLAELETRGLLQE